MESGISSIFLSFFRERPAHMAFYLSFLALRQTGHSPHGRCLRLRPSSGPAIESAASESTTQSSIAFIPDCSFIGRERRLLFPKAVFQFRLNPHQETGRSASVPDSVIARESKFHHGPDRGLPVDHRDLRANRAADN